MQSIFVDVPSHVNVTSQQNLGSCKLRVVVGHHRMRYVEEVPSWSPLRSRLVVDVVDCQNSLVGIVFPLIIYQQ